MIEINELKYKLCQLYDKLIEYKIDVVFTNQNIEVINILNNIGRYSGTSLKCTSYKFLNNYYNITPIFLFKFNKNLTKDVFISELIFRLPISSLDDKIIILDYNSLDIKFEGEYYEWCDFHLLINNVFGYVPSADNLLDHWDRLTSDNSETIEGLSRDHCELYKNLEAISHRLNIEPYNLALVQIIINTISKDNILDIF